MPNTAPFPPYSGCVLNGVQLGGRCGLGVKLCVILNIKVG